VTASSEPPLDLAGEADLPDLEALVAAAGWNQTAADWRLFLDHGRVWCLRDAAGRAVASAALLPYPPATAWISMVLTLPEARGRGHGTRLFAHALAAAEAQGLAPQLDATPLGRPIYQAAGFRSLAGLHRWRRRGQPTSRLAAAPGGPRAAEATAWDAQALGLARPWLIEALLARGPARISDSGIALSRQGRKAVQLGPIVAGDETAAAALLGDMLAGLGPDAEVVIDAVDSRPGFTAALLETGFTVERPFTRMAKGAVPRGDDALLYAIAGPELG
jgi:GNAT superfamily N-acetyltransferase